MVQTMATEIAYFHKSDLKHNRWFIDTLRNIHLDKRRQSRSC